MNKLVSVVIPVYNVEKYLRKCVKSVVEQTYPHVEILLIDDGSTDRSGQLCDELQREDSRIRAFHKKNGGQSEARNLGVENAKGEYITFVDSDDWIDENAIERMVQCAQNVQAELVCCGYKELDESGKILKLTEQPEGVYNDEEALLLLLKGKAVHNMVGAKLLKRELAVRIKFPQGCIHEDDFVVFRWIYASNRIGIVKNAMYNYLRRPGSTMMARFNEKRLVRIDAARELYQETLRHERKDIQRLAYVRYIEALRSMYICGMKYLGSGEISNLYPYKQEIYKECRKALRILHKDEINKSDIFLISYFPLYFQIYRSVRIFAKKLCGKAAE